MLYLFANHFQLDVAIGDQILWAKHILRVYRKGASFSSSNKPCMSLLDSATVNSSPQAAKLLFDNAIEAGGGRLVWVDLYLVGVCSMREGIPLGERNRKQYTPTVHAKSRGDSSVSQTVGCPACKRNSTSSGEFEDKHGRGLHERCGR